MSHKPSFFERLTGALNYADENEELIEPVLVMEASNTDMPGEAGYEEVSSKEGQLAVDVYQTDNDVIVKTMMAGVRPEDIEVAITRDSLTVRGHREEANTVNTDGYAHKELYWGTFSRTVQLPEEIEVENTEAIERHGLLIIRLPKVNKFKQAKISVRSA